MNALTAMEKLLLQKMSAIRSFDCGVKNLALCDFRGADDTILKWEVFAAPSIHALFAALDARPFVGHVIIEKQSKKSVKMLAIQHWLQSYYVLKGNPVTIFSPIHKLKGTGQENSGRTNYRARKKAAVGLTTEWLQKHPQDPAIHTWFAGSKKKDDAADTLLAVLAFLKRAPDAAGQSVMSTKLVCRVPTLRQQQTGRYSPSNLKHVILKDWKCEDAGQLEEQLMTNRRVAQSVSRHFGSAAECWRRVVA